MKPFTQVVIAVVFVSIVAVILALLDLPMLPVLGIMAGAGAICGVTLSVIDRRQLR